MENNLLKVLTTGLIGHPFRVALEASALPVQIRFVEHPQQHDIDWAECLACFPPSLKLSLQHVPWIHSFGAGLDGFLARKDLNPNLRLSRTIGHLGQKMGEFCLCHLLNFLHNTAVLAQNMETGTWQQKPSKPIRDKTVLILGTGKMAQGVAQALSTLGANIMGVNSTGRADSALFHRCLTMAAVPDVANEVSCIINTLPLHKHTRQIIDLPWLSHFHNALLINVGRGGTIKTDDLQQAFDENFLTYAVLDVFEKEPLEQDSWLWQHPQVFVSPHQAALTDVEDVMMSFTQALQARETGIDAGVFIDLRKGY